MCAPNGARKTKRDHPALPLTPLELAACAAEVLDAGAAVLHLHVRDADGRHTLDGATYRTAIEAIERKVGDELVIQVTTEACGIYSADEQMALVRDLKPEAVSVALRELCADEQAEARAAEFYAWMDAEGICAQHILYSPQEVLRFESLRQRGVIPTARPFVLFVLGRYASNLVGDARELDLFIANAPPSVVWAVCCFGETEHAAVVKAIAAGGHARVGFENNLVLPDGQPAKSNAALIEAAVEVARGQGRSVARAKDVRALLR